MGEPRDEPDERNSGPGDLGVQNAVLLLDRLDWIHAICQQIPDRGQHLTRYYGAYSNRIRKALPPNDGSQTGVAVPAPPEPDFDKPLSPSRASWARLIRKVFEVDPLLCKCGAEMKIIAVLPDPKVVDHIIRHLDKNAVAARSPPPISAQLPTVASHDNL